MYWTIKEIFNFRKRKLRTTPEGKEDGTIATTFFSSLDCGKEEKSVSLFLPVFITRSIYCVKKNISETTEAAEKKPPEWNTEQKEKRMAESLSLINKLRYRFT
jgi:hypothetical protein